jgi:hypothetical protein
METPTKFFFGIADKIINGITNSIKQSHFSAFLCLFDIRKVGQRKTLSSQMKIWLGFQKSIFLENLGRKHFPKVVKNLEMSYYLLIISNFVLKLLIAIYILKFTFLKFIFFKKITFQQTNEVRKNTIWTPKGRYHVKPPFTVVEIVAMQVFSTTHGSLKL